MLDTAGARAADLDRIVSLLSEADLPTAGVAEVLDSFLVIRDRGLVVAAGVVERHGEDGLLRSIVVDPANQGLGLGKQIASALIASENRDLYLLTETAESFFTRLGFELIPRTEAPAALRASEEFRCLCPESASFMRRSVESV
jgi:N-acetylglutamate synthase-like GNAT family acetyltransferase